MREGEEGMYVLLHVFLSCHYGALAYLEAHLGGWVVHEAIEAGLHVALSHAAHAALLLLW